MTICPCCKHTLAPCFQKQLLRNYIVQYFRCSRCGYIGTEKPYWLSEAYSEAIADMDTGILQRNLKQAAFVPWFIRMVIGKDKQYVDYGGGYGIFTRLMRDRGFEYFWTDAYAKNLFAKAFEAHIPEQQDAPIPPYALLTAFEVLEHVEDIANTLEDMLRFSDTILCTTLLLPAVQQEKLQTAFAHWWYWSPETGQHISFYTEKALKLLADRFGLYFFSNGRNLHCFSRSTKPRYFFMVLRIIDQIRHFLPGKNGYIEKDRDIYKNTVKSGV